MSEVDPIVAKFVYGEEFAKAKMEHEAACTVQELCDLAYGIRSDQDAISTARERKACMADVCPLCEDGIPIERVPDDACGWWHEDSDECLAHQIRTRAAKESAK